MHCDNLTILVDTWKMAINMNQNRFTEITKSFTARIEEAKYEQATQPGPCPDPASKQRDTMRRYYDAVVFRAGHTIKICEAY